MAKINLERKRCYLILQVSGSRYCEVRVGTQGRSLEVGAVIYWFPSWLFHPDF